MEKTKGIHILIIAAICIGSIFVAMLYILGENPENAVDKYLTAYNEEDDFATEVGDIISNKIMTSNQKDCNEEFLNNLAKNIKNIEYSIDGVETEKDFAKVSVNIMSPNIADKCKESIKIIAKNSEETHRTYINSEEAQYEDFDVVTDCCDGLNEKINTWDEKKTYNVVIELEKNGFKWRVKDISDNEALLDALSGGMSTFFEHMKEDFEHSFEDASNEAIVEYEKEELARWEAERATMRVATYDEAYNYAEDYLWYLSSMDGIRRSISNGSWNMMFSIMAGEKLEQNIESMDMVVRENGQEKNVRGWSFYVSYDINDKMGLVRVAENGNLYAIDELFMFTGTPSFKYNVFDQMDFY